MLSTNVALVMLAPVVGSDIWLAAITMPFSDAQAAAALTGTATVTVANGVEPVGVVTVPDAAVGVAGELPPPQAVSAVATSTDPKTQVVSRAKY